MRLLSVFLMMGLVSLPPFDAMAGGRAELAALSRAFDESVLRNDDDNAKPASVRKWTGPIRLAFTNASRAPGLVDATRKAIGLVAAETATITVVDVAADDGSANFVVSFDENESASGKRNCFARVWFKNWAIQRAELKINPAYGTSIDGCIIHEGTYAFGFLSHPHGADSVLSYVYKRRALTPVDILLIRTLYSPRLQVGTKPAAASQLACRILGELTQTAAADIEAVCADRKGPSI